MELPQESLDITRRFFEAINMIVEQKRMRGLQSFTRKYGINYWNCTTTKNENGRIRPEWLTYLVRDYDVSATWLLTGRGGMFSKGITPREKFSYIKKDNTSDNDTD